VFESILNAFRAPDLRRRILYVAGILIVFRLLAHVPIPGINIVALRDYINDTPIISLLDVFSGGGLSNFSLVALGVNPYINASIIMQLMTGVVPSLQALQREGEYGRTKLNQFTRYLSVPMALLQAWGVLALLSFEGVLTTNFGLGDFQTITQIVTLTAGSVVLMWLGELITEKGIGNGISFIIFAGIVARAPGAAASFLSSDVTRIVLFAIFAVIAVAVIIYVQEGQRRIPVQYASRVRGRRMYQGGQTFLPLRVNQAGVIPIIFAVSILLFPGQIATYFTSSDVEVVRQIASGVSTLFSQSSPLYVLLYFLLTVGFTYFYTAFTFKPDETAEQLRKNGGFIPGIRPGRPTQDYLARVVTRITVAGALFLGVVAALPPFAGLLSPDLQGLALGGTSILIVVSVVVETMKQLEAQLLIRQYEGFIR
jgi:preprotein translocase subunit SecY